MQTNKEVLQLIKRMEKETLGKVYRKDNPATPDGRKINAIISKAKKLKVSNEILLELEKLAFKGFIEYLNEFGSGPDNFDGMSCRHLESYLNIIKEKIIDLDKQKTLFEETRKYLSKLDNMITDYLYDTYESVTGERIS